MTEHLSGILLPHRYRDDLVEYCERRLAAVDGIQKGMMMGHAGWRIVHNNKFFLFVGEEGLILKLPPARDDVEVFNPMGGKKPMGTWVEWIKPDAPGYDDDWAWFVPAALEFVASESANKNGKR